ncbi:MAG: hypothetical protein MZW92_79880 [Comamonadaceae bacterium]|nr:hypothetical protein [Comamonadaceae bacterium]
MRHDRCPDALLCCPPSPWPTPFPRAIPRSAKSSPRRRTASPATSSCWAATARGIYTRQGRLINDAAGPAAARLRLQRPDQRRLVPRGRDERRRVSQPEVLQIQVSPPAPERQPAGRRLKRVLPGVVVAAHGRHYLVRLDDGHLLHCFPARQEEQPGLRRPRRGRAHRPRPGRDGRRSAARASLLLPQRRVPREADRGQRHAGRRRRRHRARLQRRTDVALPGRRRGAAHPRA